MGVSEFKKDHGSYMSEQTYWTLWDGCRALQTIIPRLLFSTFNLALKSRHPSYYISPPRIFHSMNGTKNHWRLKNPFKTGESTKSKLAGIRPRTVIICISTTNSSSQTHADLHSVIMYMPQTSVIFRLQFYCNLQHMECPIIIIIIMSRVRP